MIANESASNFRTLGMTEIPVPDSHLICADCTSSIGEEDSFCQECGATLNVASAVKPIEVAVTQYVQQDHKTIDYVSSTKRFSMLIGVIAAIGLSIFAVTAIAGSYDAMSEDYISEHAKKLLSANDSIQAAEILQRLYFARGNKLKQQTQDLLGLALVNRSDLYAGRNQIELATKDLKDVPPNSAQSSLAAEKLSKFALPAVPVTTLVEPVKTVASKPAVVVTKARVPELLPPVAKVASSPRKADDAIDDVSNYNRLLTAYFEKAGAESEILPDTSADDPVQELKPVREPPTLKEWVKAGRPEF